jgi:hypothetical protein
MQQLLFYLSQASRCYSETWPKVKSVAVTELPLPLILTAESPARERFGTVSALASAHVKAAGLVRTACDPTLNSTSALLVGKKFCEDVKSRVRTGSGS